MSGKNCKVKKGDLEASPGSGVAFSFGPFRLIPTQQQLLQGDKPVRLGSRALDILIALVERRGEIVSKEELVRQVWPDTFVEEGSLRVQIAALRRVLGDDQPHSRCIANIAGRGYRFVAPVVAVEMPTQIQARAIVGPAHNLPPALTRMIGRSEVVGNLVTQLSHRRFMTISGPGGIGKTAVALAVAHELVASFADGVWFVDLAPLSDPALVVSTLASALDIAIRIEDPLPRLLAHLVGKEMLLVFDNCEHVIEAAAGLAEEVLKGVPGVRILTTSREPLSAEGEAVVRLAPLGAPPAATDITASEALTYPALQLFVERAAFCLDTFELTDADAPAAAEICRRLDGIPLAIEFAAGRIDALGVRGLAEQLNNRFGLLTRGQRTALPRHQTLRATLDWSHDLLSVVQRVIFRRLGVFTGWFTAEAAALVVCGEDLSASDLISVIADLTAKSLVTADIEGPVAHYRLLETTRGYAFERLVDADEVEPVLRLHADCYRKLFETAEREWEVRPKDWLTAYARQIDDVRAALDWAFSSNGDVAIGIALTAAAVPLWHQLALFNECRERVGRALSALDAGDVKNGEGRRRQRLHLQMAYGQAMMWTKGFSADETEAAYARASELASDGGAVEDRYSIYYGQWLNLLHRSEVQQSRATAEAFLADAVAAGKRMETAVAHRTLALNCFLLGEFAEARSHAARVMELDDPARSAESRFRFGVDCRICARLYLALANWQIGEVEEASRLFQEALTQAARSGHVKTVANTGNFKAIVEAVRGDAEAADRTASMVFALSREHGMKLYMLLSEIVHLWARSKLGDRAAASKLRQTVANFKADNLTLVTPLFTGLLAELDAGGSDPHDALAQIDSAIALAQQTGERWADSMLHRIRGEILLKRDSSNPAPAEQAFQTAIAIANRQGARSFGLRAALALAKLYQSTDRPADANTVLASALEGFSPTPEMPEIAEAQALLERLADGGEGRESHRPTYRYNDNDCRPHGSLPARSKHLSGRHQGVRRGDQRRQW